MNFSHATHRAVYAFLELQLPKTLPIEEVRIVNNDSELGDDMVILAYQFVIVMMLALTRLLAPDWLVTAAWVWTGFTLLNLFWPPLVVMQLIVIWGTFGLLNRSRSTVAAAEPCRPKDSMTSSKGAARSIPTNQSARMLPEPPPVLPPGTQESGLSSAAEVLREFVRRQKVIQAETSAMLSGCKIERQHIERALETAERKLNIQRELAASAELRKHFEATRAELQALFDKDEMPGASTAVGRAEHECVDFRLPARHKDPLVAAAVERKYLDAIDEHSTLLKEVAQRLHRRSGLRDIFEKEMLNIGGANILGRIQAFEAGQEWRYASPASIERLNSPTAAPQSSTQRAAPGGIDIPRACPSKALDSQVDPNIVPEISGAVGTRFAPDQHAPSASRPVAISTSVSNSPNAAATKASFRPAYVRQKESLPQIDREGIEKAAIAMRIPALFHFTRCSNLGSILEHGLCSVARAGELGLKPNINDIRRLDGYPDAVSLSIAFPNDRMFFKYRQAEPNENWVILGINPAILWRNNCAFCERNAADHRIRDRSLAELMSAEAFHGMFKPIDGVASRAEQRLMGCDPTDPQAEVLVFETIKPDEIIALGFDGQQSLDAFAHLLGDREAKVLQRDKGLFGARSLARDTRN